MNSCMRCRNHGSLDESYVNINATSVLNPAISFSMLREKETIMNHADVSSHVKKIQRIHSLNESITTNSTVSIPCMCTECIQILTQMIDKSDLRAREEKKALNLFLLKKKKNEKIKSIEINNKLLKKNILKIKNERNEIKNEKIKLFNEIFLLNKNEMELWYLLNNKINNINLLNDEKNKKISKLIEIEKRYHIIRHINILNDLFYIWHKGPFGTINSFSIGRLTQYYIDWNEINCGWGEVAIVILLLSKELNFLLNGYQIIPLGSASKIIRFIPLPSMEYLLHGTDLDNYPESSFNLGLGALLVCLEQLGEYVESKDITFRLPYKIDGCYIGGVSILYLRDDETWTKACKYFLTNLKWLLAWCGKNIITSKENNFIF